MQVRKDKRQEEKRRFQIEKLEERIAPSACHAISHLDDAVGHSPPGDVGGGGATSARDTVLLVCSEITG